MKLYTFPSAPSPQRVHFFLQEKGLEIPCESVDLRSGEQLGDAYKSINPRCTVPALVLDDGTMISEVIAICRYLESAYPKNPLMGVSAQEQALICEWDHRVEQECLLAIAEVLRNRSDAFKGRALPGALDVEQIPALVDRGFKRIDAFYKVLDHQLSMHPFVAGCSFSIADISAFVAVNFARWIKVDVSADLSHLHRWKADVAKRPAMTMP